MMELVENFKTSDITYSGFKEKHEHNKERNGKYNKKENQMELLEQKIQYFKGKKLIVD